MRRLRAHTLTEVLLASVVAIFLFASAFGAFVVTKKFYSSNVIEYNLQRNVNTLIGRMVRGMQEQTGTFGLRSATGFTLPVVTPAGSELDFTGTDGNTRSFTLVNNTIVYISPTQSPTAQTIYTPPAGATITLLFWQPTGFTDNETVAIYCGVTQPVGSRTVSGSATTYVNLRNVPK